jgi:hypothetical protein
LLWGAAHLARSREPSLIFLGKKLITIIPRARTIYRVSSDRVRVVAGIL